MADSGAGKILPTAGEQLSQEQRLKTFPGLNPMHRWVFERGLPTAFHPLGLFHAVGEPRYLRFSSDLRVFEFTTARLREHEDRLTVKSVAAGSVPKVIDYWYWHAARYLSFGTYRIRTFGSETRIDFATHSSTGQVDHQGQISGNRLEVKWQSRINLSTGADTYEFIAFQDPKFANDVPRRIIVAMMESLNGPDDIESKNHQ